ncbi:general substrate transporter [Nemania sp. FL0031]|nr:general substrate transporter [Nemania sp. FL0031]
MAEPRRSAWSLATPMLLYSCFCLLVGDVLFGYDTASFGGILTNPGFINQFGTYDPSTRKYAFTSLHTSLLSSLAFIGKFIGCLVAGPAIERFGHRVVFFGLSIVSVIGVIIEITSAGTAAGSGRYAQFIVGRIIVYISVGLVEVDVTTYQAEIVPAPFRGLVVVSLPLFLNAGSLVATGVNRAFSTDTSHVGWRSVTGIQFIFPILITLFTIFIPSSPRWLLSKSRREEAIAALRRLRPKTAEAESECEAEVQAIQEALHQHVEKAPWLELLRGSNLRRTMIVMVHYFLQQTTGQAFVSTYQTTFLKQNGFAAEAFTYPVINTALSFVAVIPAMYLVIRLVAGTVF